MKSGPLRIPEDVKAEIAAMNLRGVTVEEMIARMRERGLPKISSIAVLAAVTKVGLGRAKELVHFSPVWEDRRASDDAFHDSLYEAAVQAGFVEVEESALKSGTHG
ncbi:MAG TPA: hypothetical protein VIJ79_18360 [Acidobacteriaceae bacterium]